jgi:hypothetical protein
MLMSGESNQSGSKTEWVARAELCPEKINLVLHDPVSLTNLNPAFVRLDILGDFKM